MPRNPQPLYSSRVGPARTVFGTRVVVVEEGIGYAMEPQLAAREEATVAVHNAAAGQREATPLAVQRLEDLHAALAVVLLDNQGLVTGRRRYESTHRPRTTEGTNAIEVLSPLDPPICKRSVRRLPLEPRVVQRLGVSHSNRRYVLQTDAVLWVGLQESVNEVLRIVAQSRVSTTLRVVVAAAHGVDELLALVREREAPRQTTPHSTHRFVTSRRSSRRATRCPPSPCSGDRSGFRDTCTTWCPRRKRCTPRP